MTVTGTDSVTSDVHSINRVQVKQLDYNSHKSCKLKPFITDFPGILIAHRTLGLFRTELEKKEE